MKRRLLIIDDEDKIRDIYVRLFKSIGAGRFQIYQAADAVQATNILVRNKIDLVLLDIKIPRVDGRQMFEIINEYDPTLKIIVASVYPIERQMALVPHAADYHDKSQGVLSLLEKINRAFSDQPIQTVGSKERTRK